jgi:RNA polymerase sigma factor (sigma-70 family)
VWNPAPWKEAEVGKKDDSAALFYDAVVRYGRKRAWKRYPSGFVDDREEIPPTYHPRTAEQEQLIERKTPLAEHGGEKWGRKHPDRIRFRYEWPVLKGWKTPPPAFDAPEDEVQEAYAALIEVLTPQANKAAYQPRPGKNFDIALRKRIKGAVIESFERGGLKFVKERVQCDPCEGSCCTVCLGSGKRNRWLRVEIYRPLYFPESDDLDETADDNRDAFSWDAPGRGPDPEQSLLAAEKKRLVADAIPKLNPLHESIIRWRFWDDERQEVIAARLNVDQGTVSRYELDARNSLKFVFGALDRDHRNLRYTPRSLPPRRSGGAFALRSSRRAGITSMAIAFPATFSPNSDGDLVRRAKTWLRLLKSPDAPPPGSPLPQPRDVPVFYPRREDARRTETLLGAPKTKTGDSTVIYGHWELSNGIAGALWLTPDTERPDDLAVKAIVAPGDITPPIGIPRRNRIGWATFYYDDARKHTDRCVVLTAGIPTPLTVKLEAVTQGFGPALGGTWPSPEWKRQHPDLWAQKGPRRWNLTEADDERGTSDPGRLVGLDPDPLEPAESETARSFAFVQKSRRWTSGGDAAISAGDRVRFTTGPWQGSEGTVICVQAVNGIKGEHAKVSVEGPKPGTRVYAIGESSGIVKLGPIAVNKLPASKGSLRRHNIHHFS